MKKAQSLLAAVWILVGCVPMAAAATPAAEVLRQAQMKAAAEGKNVFLIFGAQACSWCKVFKKFREAEETKPILEKYFVEAHLQLGDDDTANPGADAFATKYKLSGGGVPSHVFLKAEGTPIIDSKENKTGVNIGYPAAPSEIAWFMKMLDEAAPQMTALEKQTIENKLKAFKRK